METNSAFSGRSRIRKTRIGVVLIDHAARALITVGGLGTILAVLGVAAFLIVVAWPLMRGSSAELSEPIAVEAPASAPVHAAVDAFKLLSWTLHGDGLILLRRLDTGEVLEQLRPFGDRQPTVLSTPVQGELFAAGFGDGTAQLFSAGFETEFFEPSEAPAALEGLKIGEVLRLGEGLAQLTSEGQVRVQSLKVETRTPVETGSDRPLVLLDHVEQSRGTVIATMDSDERVFISRVRFKRNLMTGKITAKTKSAELPTPPSRGAAATHLLLAGLGESLCLAWEDGHLLRYDTADLNDPTIAERVELLGGDRRLTAFRPLLGRSTLLAGDSDGGLAAWFTIKPDGASTPDGAVLVRAHELPAAGASVTALSSSARSRMVAVGDAAGVLRLVQVTTESKLLELQHGSHGPITVTAIAPKDNALLALTPAGQQAWNVDLGHPEATASSLFRPTWYEGYEQPAHAWQSSSGTDDFEVKLGLWPLVFGTLKATLYSMLFGAPIALLAAVYTSEFLPRSITSKVKPGIELMASLPSVVLGFLAGLVVAPWMERHLSEVLTTIYLLPLVILLGAQLWQLLPRDVGLRAAPWRPLACLLALLITPVLGIALAPLAERIFFSGNITIWLDGQTGSGTGGWMLLLIPATALFVGTLVFRVVDENLPAFSNASTPRAATLLSLARFAVGLCLTLLLAWLLSWLLTAFGFDPRGTYISTYVQRNALIVGFAMGFAIIPIIYTIADDALSSVPSHLRSASLGCGATQWQTTVRVVIPTAMSGLFSALMIGLGRAVGETMIVLMAAGNTPVTDWNIFSGFRTLSANIAVELPEAVRDSTHYRTLFLAALVLFGLTFIVNTLAEVVRERFRKRAYEA